MSILLIGLNHRTAPVEVREQLAFSRDGVATALMLFRSRFPESEAVILSTCNRVEIIASFGDGDAATAELGAVSRGGAGPVGGGVRVAPLCRRGTEVFRHLFRVISGLDSMVLGEYQIVNQLKQAYQLAHEQKTTGRVLHRLFHHAFGVSKRVRTETSIGDGKTSIPSVAVDVIGREVQDFAGQAHSHRRRGRDGAAHGAVPLRGARPVVRGHHAHADQRQGAGRGVSTARRCRFRTWMSSSRSRTSSSRRRRVRRRS